MFDQDEAAMTEGEGTEEAGPPIRARLRVRCGVRVRYRVMFTVEKDQGED